MASDDVTRETEPVDRLTRLAGALVDALAEHPEYTSEIKAIVLLNDRERGGICLHGYDRDTEAIADLFVHLRSICEANGRKVIIAPLGRAESL
jgi:hypothetical protein